MEALTGRKLVSYDIKALFAPLPEIKGDDDAPKKRGRAKKA